MTTTPTVRTATGADEPALRALDGRAWTRAAVFPSVLATLGTHPFFDDRHPPGDHLVAEIDGTVVGYLRLQPPTPMPESSHVVGVNGLAVDPAARGRGVARSLLAAAEARARDAGAVKVSLRVLGTNVPARRLYEAAGYVVEGRLVAEFRIDGVDVDDYVMARYLDGDPG